MHNFFQEIIKKYFFYSKFEDANKISIPPMWNPSWVFGQQIDKPYLGLYTSFLFSM